MPVSYREFAAIDNLLRLRPDASSFRATYGGERIEVFRRFDPDVEDMLATFGVGNRSGQSPRSGSAPMLRFTLQDEQARTFTIERYVHDEWHVVAEAVAARNLVDYVRSIV